MANPYLSNIDYLLKVLGLLQSVSTIGMASVPLYGEITSLTELIFLTIYH